jgi:hypothetical protein
VKVSYAAQIAVSTACCAIALVIAPEIVPQVAVAQVAPGAVSITGTLRPGQPGQVPYEAIKPANWNGTLVVDLDFTSWKPALRQWYLDHGIAVGGVHRLTDSGGYDLQAAADNLVEVRRLFSEKVGTTPR